MARPDMYISSPGSTPRWLAIASVLLSLTPKVSPPLGCDLLQALDQGHSARVV